jgi:hypothetical protein
MSDPLRVQMFAPLSVFAAGFLEELLERGYRPGTAAKQLQLMAHLNRWMAARDLEPAELRRVEIERFVRERRASGRGSIRSDLSVDWADRANTEAAIRSKIKRLLRKPQYREAVRKYIRNGEGGGGLDVVAQRIFDQARTLYRYWPDVETDRLFEPGHGLS